MAGGFFSGMAAHSALIDLRKTDTKILVISDLHMGCGKRDDLAANGSLLISMLKYYYYPGGWFLVLNGDVEELHRYSFQKIEKQWPELYRAFDLFAAENRLYKTLGNHDEDLVFEKNYPYPLYHALRIETTQLPIFIYHGHQSSLVYSKYNAVIRSLVRYILTPFGIRNISAARNPRRRFFVEKQAYNFSMENNCISIIGHTHRALFESLSRFDFIKFEIERLCRDYPSMGSQEKMRTATEVSALRTELGKLKRSERRNVLRQSLYGDEFPVPCLFNSGSAISRRGINALELQDQSIALVYWFTEGNERKFVRRGNYRIEKLRETPYCRTVLNQDRLDYIKARMELCGT
ncbi:MAG: metallophosphoesterase [Treponema sp.]|nr:metallophosphoesterase [Treponema sp.]